MPGPPWDPQSQEETVTVFTKPVNSRLADGVWWKCSVSRVSGFLQNDQGPQCYTSLQSWWPAQGIYELVTLGFDEEKVWNFMCEEYFENSLWVILSNRVEPILD